MSQSDSGVKRRGLLKFGSLITAITGASAISAIGATSAEAGPGDKTPATTYVPTAEKGAPLGVATLDVSNKVPNAQIPDLSALYSTPAALTAATAPANAPNPITSQHNVQSYGATGNGSTNDTAAIHNARTAAGINGTLFFPPGTYRVDGLQANVVGQTWLLSQGAILKETDASSSQYVLRVTADNVTLSGGAIDGNKGVSPNGNPFQIRPAASPGVVRNTTIQGVSISNATGYGIYASSVLNLLIQRCTISRVDGGAMYLPCDHRNASSDIRILNNYIDQRETIVGGGITLAGTSTLTNKRAIISGNTVLTATQNDASHSGVGCIGGNYSDSVTVTGNTCLGSYIGISFPCVTRLNISGNTVSGFYRYGIEIAMTSQDVTLSNNVVDGTGSSGQCIALNDSCNRVTVSNNTCQSNGTFSVIYAATAVRDATLTGNIVTYTGTANEVIALNGASGVVFSNNYIDAGTCIVGLRSIGGVGNLAISGNRFKNATQHAIAFDTSTATCDYLTVTGNVLTNTPALYAVLGGNGLGANKAITGNVPNV